MKNPGECDFSGVFCINIRIAFTEMIESLQRMLLLIAHADVLADLHLD